MIDLDMFFKFASNQINRTKDKRRYKENMKDAIELKLELFDGEMNLKKFVTKLSKELDLPSEYVYRVYTSVFEAIEYVMNAYPDPMPLSDQEFEALPFHKFVIPHAGAITLDHLKYKKRKVKKIIRSIDDKALKAELSTLTRIVKQTDQFKDDLYSEVRKKRASGDTVDLDYYKEQLKLHTPLSRQDYAKAIDEVIKDHMDKLPEFGTNNNEIKDNGKKSKNNT